MILVTALYDFLIVFSTYEGQGREVVSADDALEAVILFRRFHPGYTPLSVRKLS